MCVWVCDGLSGVDLILQIRLLLREYQVCLLHRESEHNLMSRSPGNVKCPGCVCMYVAEIMILR